MVAVRPDHGWRRGARGPAIRHALECPGDVRRGSFALFVARARGHNVVNLAIQRVLHLAFSSRVS